jgi:hypothetical protein
MMDHAMKDGQFQHLEDENTSERIYPGNCASVQLFATAQAKHRLACVRTECININICLQYSILGQMTQ